MFNKTERVIKIKRVHSAIHVQSQAANSLKIEKMVEMISYFKEKDDFIFVSCINFGHPAVSIDELFK